MSREFGKLYMTMWADRDFVALTPEAQRLYMFLISQPDLSRAGTITLALRRWSRSASGLTPEGVEDALGELACTRFVVVDDFEEELLVRSYIKNDEGWRSPNIMKSICGAAKATISETLRAVVRDEMARIDTSDLPTKINERTGQSTKDFIEGLISVTVTALASCEKDAETMAWGDRRKGSGKGSMNPSVKGSGEGSAEDENQPFAEGFIEGFPEGSLTTTATATATATATETTTAEIGARASDYPAAFAPFWDAYPRKAGKRDALKAWTKATRRASPTEIADGAARFASDPNLPEEQFIPYPSKWLNGDHWEDDPLPDRKRPQKRDANPLDKWQHAFNQLGETDHHMIEGAS